MRDELLAFRKKLKWTQREAAEYLDVPLKTYEGWEQGHRQVQNPGPVRRLIRIVEWPGQAQAIMDKASGKPKTHW